MPSETPWPTWLKSATAIGAKVDLSVDGPTGTTKHASFPIGKLVSQIQKDNAAPIIRATVNIPVLSKYKLYDNDGNFSHIDMPLTLVRVENNKGMTDLINALTTVTGAIKLPPSPFEPGVAAFGSFVSEIFKADSSNTPIYPNAIIGFDLIDDESECATNGQALRTGAQSQIFTSPSTGKGIIAIENYANYCFYSSGGIDPNILYSDMPKNGICTAIVPGNPQTLNNPQIIFVVNAYPNVAITKSSTVIVTPRIETSTEKTAAVIVTPQTVASIKNYSTTSSDEFSEFAKAAHIDAKAPGKNVELGDLISLHSLINDNAFFKSGKPFNLQLTAYP